MSLSTHEELLLLRKRARRRLVGAVFLVLLATGVLWNVLGHLPEQEMRPESVEISGLRPASAPVAVAQASQPAAQASQGVASAPETDILASLPPEDSVLPPPEAVASKPVAKVPAAPVVVPPPAAVLPPAAVVARPAPEPAHAAKVIEAKPQPAQPKPSEKPQPVEKKAEKKVEKKAEKKLEEAPVKKTVPDPAAILEGRDDAPPAAKKADKTDKAADKAGSSGKFQVQMAALSDPDKVSSLKQRLSGAGISAHFSKVQTSKGEVTRVRIGPFGNRADADAALRKLERAGVSGIIVTQ